MRCVWHWLHQRRRCFAYEAHVCFLEERIPKRIVEQIIAVLVPLSMLEETVAVMKLAPHEHAQTGPDGPADAEYRWVTPAAVHQQGCWRVRDGAETSPPVQVEKRGNSRDVSVLVQRQSCGFQLYNREQTAENRCHRCSSRAWSKSRSQSRKFRRGSKSHSYSLYRKRCDPRSSA